MRVKFEKKKNNWSSNLSLDYFNFAAVEKQIAQLANERRFVDEREAGGVLLELAVVYVC